MPGLNIVNMREGIRKATGIEDGDPDLTTAQIDLYLNRALWEIDNKFPFKEKEKTVTFETVSAERNYDVPTPVDAVKSLAISDLFSKETKTLRYMETFEYDNLYDADTYNMGKPWGYTRENCFVRLWPTPDKIYTIIMKRWIILSDLDDTNDIPEIPIVWHEVIQLGGLWRAFIDIGDIARANQIKNHQIAIINSIIPTQVKEEGNDKYAGLEVLRADYDGGQWWSRN
jgi:hypothetical protein